MSNNILTKEEKIGAIAGDSFCIYPFKSINIMPAGIAKPCCAFQQPLESGEMSVYENSLENVWNSDLMRETRRAMIEGTTVDACNYCDLQEKSGIVSMREEANRNWTSGFLNEIGETVEELKAHTRDEGFYTSGPEYLDLDMGNLCNLKCRMCTSLSSSGIASDNVHSRWAPTIALARWQGLGSIIAPRRVIGVSYHGIGYPDQSIPEGTAWTTDDAIIRLNLGTTALTGFSVKLSAERPDNHPLMISANGEVLFDGILSSGDLIYSFDLIFPSRTDELELRFQSAVFNRKSDNSVVGIGIDELKLLRTEAKRNTVTFSRFTSGKQWFQDQDFLLKELLQYPEHIKKLNVIGGEPLLIKEVRYLMRYLIDINMAKNITLVLTTNGTVADDEWFELTAQFKSIVVAVSIDGFSGVNDYIRFPSEWGKIAINLQKFRMQPNTTLFVNDTIQAYNILNVVDLLDFCKQMNVPFRYHLLQHPPYLSVSVLPLVIRQEAARRLECYQAELASHTTDHSGIANDIQLLISALEADSTLSPSALRDFMIFTNDLDLSRGQSIKDSVPELVNMLSNAGVSWISDTKFHK